jgi:hypothetical protein
LLGDAVVRAHAFNGKETRARGVGTPAPADQQARADAAADECFARPAVAELTMPMATSRCRDVCGFAADDARIAIVRLDRQHDRFGCPGARYRRDSFATKAIMPHRQARRSHSGPVA